MPTRRCPRTCRRTRGEGQAAAALAKAQADSDRTADLFEHNAVAKKDVQAPRAALAQAQGGARPGPRRSRAVAAPADACSGSRGRVRPAGRRARAARRQGARVERRARRVPQRHERAGDDHRRPEHRVGQRRRCPKPTSASYRSASASRSAWSRIPARCSTAACRASPTSSIRRRGRSRCRPRSTTAHGRLRPEMFGSIHHIDATREDPSCRPARSFTAATRRWCSSRRRRAIRAERVSRSARARAT